MPVTRIELERREDEWLAPYAQRSSLTRGRVHRESPPEWRTHYQRDRDRVIHSPAFRRLEYKTQVFLNGTGDHLRTRLTHTMEVAGISRNIARALRLNEDLAETIALAHDLGHSPFGHSGENVLDRLMRGHGGFEHNRQSLRVVDSLERKYPGFPGLNLTWEAREGLMKHDTSKALPGPRPDFEVKSPSLEAQVANLADEITYYSHDLDDGIDCGLLSEAALERDVEVWRLAAALVRRKHPRVPVGTRRFFTIRVIIDEQVKDVVRTTEAAIRSSRVASADDVRKLARPLVRYSPECRKRNLELRKYLYRNLYYNPAVNEPNQRAVRMLAELFRHFIAKPSDMGQGARRRLRKEDRYRAVCDYLAGMTDRYAILEHRRIFGPAALDVAVGSEGN
ncbi:MAG: deoxyguanosinetriphosphate triphosphohydrolase [Verrucomicrobiales bacterium]|nr:deoxyguanosinetriphosphate triphosphohydrolase [Verrucomicrobiales bacterium]